jgi:hypothetical protein
VSLYDPGADTWTEPAVLQGAPTPLGSSLEIAVDDSGNVSALWTHGEEPEPVSLWVNRWACGAGPDGGSGL